MRVQIAVILKIMNNNICTISVSTASASRWKGSSSPVNWWTLTNVREITYIPGKSQNQNKQISLTEKTHHCCFSPTESTPGCIRLNKQNKSKVQQNAIAASFVSGTMQGGQPACGSAPAEPPQGHSQFQLWNKKRQKVALMLWVMAGRKSRV